MSTQAIEFHVVADSTGDTAARVARATAAQFPDIDTHIVRHPRITTESTLRSVMARIAEDGAPVVVYSTIVDSSLHDLVHELAQQLRLEHVDLLGPALGAVERVAHRQAEHKVRPVGIGADYFTRIAAMEYAVANDDGNPDQRLDQADVVLIGVSRSGKTPLSMYLGYLGYKTANIPLVRGIEPPQRLFSVPRWKVVGLTIDPTRLQDIRTRRVETLGGRQGKDGYADLARIYDELDHAEEVFRKVGCPTIDTTQLALEESAGRVIELVEDRRATLSGM